MSPESGSQSGEKTVDATDLDTSELFSEELDIDLATGTDEELFKWFLASMLFGARISTEIAIRTYRSFERHELLSPEKILDAGLEYLVDPVMREGGYVRYDYQRSDEILRNCQTLRDTYDGSLTALHAAAVDSDDLEARLDAFHRVGPVTVNIFLRELRPYWEKSDPEPLPRVEEAAERMGVDLGRYDRKSEPFVRVEAGLIRRT